MKLRFCDRCVCLFPAQNHRVLRGGSGRRGRLIFTAGIGENASLVREKLCARLAYLGIELDGEKNRARPAPAEISAPQSKVKVYVIPANEELMIASETFALLDELAETEPLAV